MARYAEDVYYETAIKLAREAAQVSVLDLISSRTRKNAASRLTRQEIICLTLKKHCSTRASVTICILYLKIT